MATRVIVARDMTAKAVTRGTYLTDGKTLVQVVEVNGGSLIVEEGSVEHPIVSSLAKNEVGTRWRVVTPRG